MAVLSLLVAPIMSLLLTRCQPPTMDATGKSMPRPIQLSRRAAVGGLFLTPATVFAFDPADADLQCEDTDEACQEKQQKAIKELIKQRAKKAVKKQIEDSKKGPVRKPTDLVENRRKTVDYSCVAATGSPCPTSEEAE